MSHYKKKKFAKYLGIHIDQKLTWEHHITHINSKLAKGSAILAKLRYFVPNKCLLNLYNAFVQPHLDYDGALVWGNSAQIQTNKIQNIQNKS